MSRIANAVGHMIVATIIGAWAWPLQSFADGTLYVSPETGVYTIGEIFDVKIMADTGGQNINAAEAELTFNPEGLEVQRISTKESILDSWPTPPIFSNEKGTLKFSGWTKNIYSGKDGILVTVTFKALRSVTSNAYLAAGAILAADGRGSNIITSMKSGLYSVAAQHEQTVPEMPSLDATSTPREDTPAPILENVTSNLMPPTFYKDSDYMDAGERIVENGKAPPNSKVLFFLGYGVEAEKFSALTSDSEGAFTFISDQGARDGVYRLRAALQDADGKISQSARMTITARAHGLVAAAEVGADIASTLIPLLTLVVVGGLGAGYLFHLHSIERLKHTRIHK